MRSGRRDCVLKVTAGRRFKIRLNRKAGAHDQLHVQGEVIMRLCFDCDLGSLAVLMIGISGVAFLAMSL